MSRQADLTVVMPAVVIRHVLTDGLARAGATRQRVTQRLGLNSSHALNYARSSSSTTSNLTAALGCDVTEGEGDVTGKSSPG